ncbi:CHAT domain-containing protein [Citromicrobium bathyomarinum]|uniref:CHAT domain-containing protein n=1 Tax=Citromicrobium bathyomarinum TaxID=72174 RepID=UPI00315A021D
MGETWNTLTDLETELRRQLEARHSGLVSELHLRFEGDTLVIFGEVGSEDCRADAKLLALGFAGIFKVWNLLEVAGFLESASDDQGDEYFFSADDSEASPGATATDGGVERSNEKSLRHGRAGSGSDSEHRDFLLRGAAPAEAEEVSRTPIIEADRHIEASREFLLKIDLIQEEISDVRPIHIGTFPTDWQEIELSINVFAPWLAEVVPEVPSVTLLPDGGSQPATFRCVAAEELPPGEVVTVQIVFMHGTRQCGCVSSNLVRAASGRAESLQSSELETRKQAIAFSPDAAGPTLSVTIATYGERIQHWHWKALVPGGVEEDAERIDLGGNDQQFAEALLRTCPELPHDAFRRMMRGIGERLWQSAPGRFRDAFLGWRQKIGQGFSIQFVTDDPHIPWEMMKPADVDIDHLFIEHPVARWPLTRGGKRQSSFPGGSILSFVPVYEEGNSLPSAIDESEWLEHNLGAMAMSANSSTFMNLLEHGHSEPVGILHFAGHGLADSGIADGGIELEDAVIRVVEVNQSAVVLGERDGTFVVLNACETAATAQMLGMNTGWGIAIAERGFGGLLAPLWEVEDGVALSFVQEALPPLTQGRSTLGEAVADARRASVDTSVSAFAYLAHGDVMARFPVTR